MLVCPQVEFTPNSTFIKSRRSVKNSVQKYVQFTNSTAKGKLYTFIYLFLICISLLHETINFWQFSSRKWFGWGSWGEKKKKLSTNVKQTKRISNKPHSPNDNESLLRLNNNTAHCIANKSNRVAKQKSGQHFNQRQWQALLSTSKCLYSIHSHRKTNEHKLGHPFAVFIP